MSVGDAALYTGLFGGRIAVQSSDAFAKAIGYPRAPLDDLLVFHVVFGKTVPDVSLNAVANLGYADCRFLKPVYPGDTCHPGLDPGSFSKSIIPTLSQINQIRIFFYNNVNALFSVWR